MLLFIYINYLFKISSPPPPWIWLRLRTRGGADDVPVEPCIEILSALVVALDPDPEEPVPDVPPPLGPLPDPPVVEETWLLASGPEEVDEVP